MLSSIHPLGERARQNSWLLTVGAFTVGAAITGAAVGVLLGWFGAMTLGAAGRGTLIVVTAIVTIVAGALDLFRVSPIGPKRQVNESWIGHYRGWVYGGGFGIQLGAGVATYVVTWGVYALFAAELLLASPMVAGAAGGVFGLGRALTLLVAGWIDRPSRLVTFHNRMAGLGPIMHRLAAGSFALFGVFALGSFL